MKLVCPGQVLDVSAGRIVLRIYIGLLFSLYPIRAQEHFITLCTDTRKPPQRMYPAVFTPVVCNTFVFISSRSCCSSFSWLAVLLSVALFYPPIVGTYGRSL